MWPAALVAVAACGALGGPASGEQRIYADSKVTFSTAAPFFHGGVKSDYSACERRRKVVVFQSRKGADRRIDADRTSRRGRWRVPFGQSRDGQFYAKVSEKVAASHPGGTGLVCGRDSSRGVYFN